jgi:hypothetical protein
MERYFSPFACWFAGRVLICDRPSALAEYYRRALARPTIARAIADEMKLRDAA